MPPKQITGYTRHGVHQAVLRDNDKGISPVAILESFRNPKFGYPELQDDNSFLYTHPDGRMATSINQDGKIVTTFAISTKKNSANHHRRNPNPDSIRRRESRKNREGRF